MSTTAERPLLYVLSADHQPVPVDTHDPVQLAAMDDLWHHSERRIVARTEVGSYTVSTVFLGVDHNWMAAGPPILFETMIWDATGRFLDYQDRYRTWQEAEAGHQETLDRLDQILEEAGRQP